MSAKNGFYVEPDDYIPEPLRKEYKLGEYYVENCGGIEPPEILPKDGSMLTLEEAVRIGKEKKPNTDHCTEYENGYMFSSSEDDNYDGGYGHTPIVVRKSDGSVTNFNAFTIEGTGDYLTEHEV